MCHCDGWRAPWAVVAAGSTQLCLHASASARAWRLIRGAGVTHRRGAR